VEYVLTALAGCVTSSIVYHAAAKGIMIKSMESRLEGTSTCRAFWASEMTSPKVIRRSGCTSKIEADTPPEKLEEILKLGPAYSPVFDTITRAVPVKVQLEK